MQRKQEKGFSLIELLVVVAILLIIAAIAVPSLLNSVRAGHESAAAQTLRTIGTANAAYKNSYPLIGYSAALANLGGTSAVCSSGAVSSTASCDLSDNNLASTGIKGGYTFTYTAPAPNAYVVIATPTSGILDGRREFCIDQSNVVHATPTGTLGAITDDASCNGQPSL
jgi:type IV pilus assembly protein PilA